MWHDAKRVIHANTHTSNGVNKHVITNKSNHLFQFRIPQIPEAWMNGFLLDRACMEEYNQTGELIVAIHRKS